MGHHGEFDETLNPYAAPAPSPEIGTAELEAVQLKPFRTIWFHPRQTVRQIITTDPNTHVVLLVSLAGIGETLDRASMRNAGDKLSLTTIVAVACLVGPLGGLLSLWIGSNLIRFSGRWIGGIGSRTHICAAIAWASVPAVFALPLWIPQVVLFGSDMFTAQTPTIDAQPALLVPFFVIVFAELVAGFWGFLLLCNTIAEVQGLRSAWAGFGNLILAGLLLFVPLMAVVISVSLLV